MLLDPNFVPRRANGPSLLTIIEERNAACAFHVHRQRVQAVLLCFSEPTKKNPPEEVSVIGPFSAGVNFTRNSRERPLGNAPHSVWACTPRAGAFDFSFVTDGQMGPV